jgi:hypothetical protein
MTPHRALRLATWIVSRLAPESEREPLVGDLMEEYAVRASESSSSAALKWYLQQVCASAPSLLWARIKLAAWPCISTLGVALLAYIAVGVVDFGVKWVIPNWTAEGGFAPNPLGMIVTSALVVVIGYFAARYRRRAPLVLAAIMMFVIVWMLWGSGESSPLWFRVAYVFVGPGAALLGGALYSGRSNA